jgi:hypothetical protein
LGEKSDFLRPSHFAGWRVWKVTKVGWAPHVQLPAREKEREREREVAHLAALQQVLKPDGPMKLNSKECNKRATL